jgi:WD40 repeat protein
MPLTTGTRLGPYEILAAIGAGGMGEVYKARDSRLNRDVALKLLPASVASDPERLGRFQREAQVLASISHPNIGQIFGFEDAGPALVLELIEGPTLADRIAAGPMPLAEVLSVARQLAEAIEAAHEHGIVHRDLKPANIKLTSRAPLSAADDGTVVKVLDFGLAKALATEAPGATADAMNSPTLTARSTQLGTILGTAAYMSPEQAKGRPADRRSDIWAYGCIVYEMLVGRRPFPGEDVSDTLAAVLRADVDWLALPRDTPRGLRELVGRCLDRNLRTRLQSIGEARVAVERLIASPAEADTEATPKTAVASVRSTWRSLALVAAAVVVTAGATAAVMRWLRPTAAPAPVHRYMLGATVPVIAGTGGRGLSISPDGRRIVFVSDQKLYVWELDQLQPRVLTGAGTSLSRAADSVTPVWSPNGQSIAYISDGKLWRIPVQDGPPAMICSLSAPGYAAWDDQDRVIFSTTRGPIYQVSAHGGEPKVLIPLTAGADVDFHQPFVLPNGRGLIYVVHRREGTDTIEVFSSGVRKVLLRVEGQAKTGPQVLNVPQYSPSGHLVYRMDQGNVGIWAVPFSLDRLETTGEPFLVTPRGVSPSISQDGTLVYAATDEDQPVQLNLFRKDGKLDRTLLEARHLSAPVFSSDGKRVAYASGESTMDIFVWDIARASASRITVTPEDEGHPAWVSGKDELVFECVAPDGGAICKKPADGSGDTKVVVHQAATPMVSPDGRYLLFDTNGQNKRGIMSLDLNDPAAKPIEFEMSPEERYPMGLSSDGRYAVYWGFQAGALKAYLRPFPSGQGLWEVPNWSIDTPLLRSGGRSLLALTQRGPGYAVVEAPFDTARGVVFSPQRDLATGLPMLVEDGFDVAPDGQIVALQHKGTRASQTGIVVVLNWLSETAKGR